MSIKLLTSPGTFNCFYFSGATLAPDFKNFHISLENNLWLTNKFPFVFSEHWRYWLGANATLHIEEANLVIYLLPQAAQNKNWEQYSKNVLHRWFLATTFLGVVGYFEANWFCNEKGISTIGELEKYNHIYGEAPLFLDTQKVKKVNEIYKSLTFIFGSSEYQRLKRGLNAYWKALREKDNYYRLPNLVKSLEALILPETGKTKEQFKERVGCFLKSAQGHIQKLEDIYQLRSRVEHLHDWIDRFPDLSRDESAQKINHLCRIAEAIARNVYLKILLEPRFIKVFDNDKSIVSFWDNIPSWLPSVDITSIK